MRRDKPFPAAAWLGERVKAAAFDRGLLVYPGSGTIDGVNGDHILLAPVADLSADDLRWVVDGLVQAIDASVTQIGEGR